MPVLHDPKTHQSAVATWIDTLGRLLDNSVLRDEMSRGGARRMEDFKRERVCPQWVALVDELLAN